jgi:hypothetical protein
VTVSPLVIQRFVPSTGFVAWLVYRPGEIHQPLSVLSDAQVRQLMRDVEWQIGLVPEQPAPNAPDAADVTPLQNATRQWSPT